MAVLEAYEPIERRWHQRLSELDVAVDEIPRISARDPENVNFPPEVIADGPIALARLIPAGVDVRGQATRARIVLFRRPIERAPKTPWNWGICCTRSWSPRWPPILESNPPLSTPRSATDLAAVAGVAGSGTAG